jgi:1-aminocyclopropane-1-carboxylate deaminase/D-cysteine desulfhydrase-like pyridoxal-dependent ACC family enzyme
VRELLSQIEPPDVIVHSSSSGGTQAGLVAGCALAGVPTRVIGVSADEPARRLEEEVRRIIHGLPDLISTSSSHVLRDLRVDVDDRFVGGGYGVSTEASREAIALMARTEAIFLDPTYTAKAMAALVAAVRTNAFKATDTVLFWHTGGQVALFA